MSHPSKPDDLEAAVLSAAAGGCGELIRTFDAKAQAQTARIDHALTKVGLSVTWKRVESGEQNARCVEYRAEGRGGHLVGQVKMCCSRARSSRITYSAGEVIGATSAWPQAENSQNWTAFARALTKKLRDLKRKQRRPAFESALALRAVALHLNTK